MQSTYLDRWYVQEVGLAILAEEQLLLNAILPTLFGYHMVFLSLYPIQSLLKSSLISHCVWVHPQKIDAAPCTLVQGDFDVLPIMTDAVDVVVLSHLLECVQDPEQVLREVHRIVRPEGVAVITGFNPCSLWGLSHAIRSVFGAKRNVQYRSIWRICNALQLLGFQIESKQSCFFRPSSISGAWLKRLAILEQWGKRWCPLFGAAYTIVAIKREVQLTPLQPVRISRFFSFCGNISCPVQQQEVDTPQVRSEPS